MGQKYPKQQTTEGRQPKQAAQQPMVYDRATWAEEYGWVLPELEDFHPQGLVMLANGWGVAIVKVDPDLATQMISTMVENQRKPKGTASDRYAADMKAGLWRTTHQGIAFNKNGRLFDGQNRLNAVVASQETVTLVVFFGAGDDEEMLVLDTGANRSAKDAANVLRIDTDARLISSIQQAIRFATPDGSYRSQKFTNSETVALLQEYQDLAIKIAGWFQGKTGHRLDRAPVRAAALAASLNGVSDNLLMRFAGVYADTIAATEPRDEAPKVLRHTVLNQTRQSGMLSLRDLFLKSCAAIQYCKQDRIIQLLRPPETSPYIMPDNMPLADSKEDK